MINLNCHGGSYSISDIQDYFECIIKMHDLLLTDNQSIKICINKIENRITFKINPTLS